MHVKYNYVDGIMITINNYYMYIAIMGLLHVFKHTVFVHCTCTCRYNAHVDNSSPFISDLY